MSTNAKQTSQENGLKQVLQDGQLFSLNAETSILSFPQFCATSVALIQQLAGKCQGENIAQCQS